MSKFHGKKYNFEITIAQKISIYALILSLMISLAMPAFAATQLWNTTTGTWSTKKNWTPYNRSPLSTDNAQINNNGTAQTTTTSNVCLNLYLGANSATTGTLDIQAGSALTVGANAYIGNSGAGTVNQAGGTNTIGGTMYIGANAGSSGVYNLNGGILSIGADISNGAGTGTLNIDGGTLTLSGNTIDVDNLNLGNAAGRTGTFTLNTGKYLTVGTETIGRSGQGTFTQAGGTATISGALYMGTNAGSTGIYDVNGGRVNINGNIIDGSGHSEVDISAGTVNFNGSSASLDKLLVGDTAGQSAIFNMGSSKTLTAGTLEVGTYGTGTFTQNGGTVTITATDFYIGRYAGSSGTYTMNGGTITGTASMIIENNASAQGRIKGYGDVALTGTLTNNGKVIADGGYDSSRDLVMSNFTAVQNTIENTSDNGWYAKNKGALVLPSIYVNTGTNTYNWGESQSDTEIDMVNSVQISFTNVTAPAWLTIKLVAPGHDNAPPIGSNNIVMWEVDAPGLAYDEATMAIRYDDYGMDEPTELQLQAWHYLNGSWLDVTWLLDPFKNIIYVKNVLMNIGGYYAVGKAEEVIPEPTSIIGIGLVIIGLIRRKISKLLVVMKKKLIHS